MSRLSAKAGALALLAAGGAAALLAASSPWAQLSAEDGLVGTSVTVNGAALAPLTLAVGVVGLAAVPAVLAVRRWLRAVVAMVVVGLGLAALVQALGVAADVEAAARSWWAVEVGALARGADVSATAWPYVSVASLAVVVAGGALVLVRGSRWAGLSSRYDAPTGGQVVPGRTSSEAGTWDADAWKALDRGEDPTESPHDPTEPGEATP